MRISFDWDGTLEYEEIQNILQTLIRKGHIIFIVTSRYDEDNKHNYHWMTPETIEKINHPLYQLATEFGINKSNIIFTNMNYKGKTLHANKIEVHFDDNPEEFSDARVYAPECKVILV